jgi:glycosyltransferase involved in cell wall biosynthesis
MNDMIQDDTLSMTRNKAGLVSVVVPCYNQGRFLAEAVESVLCQTYRDFEVIVVDDGSTDSTRDVAGGRPVRYFFQNNQGLSAARNRGIREGLGEYFVFLDADDRLLPTALRAGVEALIEHPSIAFAFGSYRVIDENGITLQDPIQRLQGAIDYTTLLRSNCIEMHATVIYRASTFEIAGAFDPVLKACEDYDMYLRVARQLLICHFDACVAEYRMHPGNMSRDARLMLRSVLQVLHTQRKYFRGDKGLAQAYQQGLREFAGVFAAQVARQTWADAFSPGRRLESLRGLGTLIRHYPVGFAERAASFCLRRLSGLRSGAGKQRK